MANARKKGKKKISFWLNEEERGLLKALADEKDLTMTDAFRVLLIRAAKKANKLPQESK